MLAYDGSKVVWSKESLDQTVSVAVITKPPYEPCYTGFLGRIFRKDPGETDLNNVIHYLLETENAFLSTNNAFW